MKTIAIFNGLFVLVTLSFAQVRTQLAKVSIVPQSGMFGAPDIQTLIDIAPIDLSKVLAEDKLEEGANVPFRFGVGVDVNYTAENSGKWYDVPGGRVWKLKVRSPGAYSINSFSISLRCPKADFSTSTTEISRCCMGLCRRMMYQPLEFLRQI